MITLVGVAWAVLVLTGAWHLAPGPPPRSMGPSAGGGPVEGAGGRGQVATLVGACLLRAAGRPPAPVASARLGWAVIAAAATLVVSAPASPAVGLVVWALPAVGERRRQRRRQALVLRDLPEVADLFVLAVGAGLTVPLAVDAVSRRAPGPMGGELSRVMGEVRLGVRLADALSSVVGRVGEEVRPLISALVASDRYGAPLLDGLVRLSAELRSDRRRRAEEAARRVPVKLLFPLVFCTLPAFALLTVAPLLAGALRALRL